MDKKQLDFEIQATEKVIDELKVYGDPGALELAKTDLAHLLMLKDRQE